MRVLRHYAKVPPDLKGGVVVIGKFDGVHRGHKAVVGRGADLAGAAELPLISVTFEPHPHRFFQPEIPPFRLTPFRVKVHQIAALGVDALLVLRFDAAFAKMTADEFIAEVLVDGLEARHVVVGYDFTFGRGREGDTEFLSDRAAASGFDFTSVDPVASADDMVYSSTAIREHLVAGKPGHAAALLGRPYEIEGRVVHGEHLGREIGFPTANIELHDYLHPAFGIYAVRVAVENGPDVTWRDGVANFGTRPTVGGTKPLLEPYIFDFDGDLYGRRIRVALIEYIRPEIRFDSIDEMTVRIEEDCAVALRILQTSAAGAA